MKSRFIYWLVYSGMWLFSALPFRILYLLSDFNYLLMYRIGRYRRKVVRENLKKSFPEKDKKERLQIERRFYRYLSDYMLEDLKMLHMSPEDLYKRMTYKNTEQYLELTEKYGGIIVMIPHYANYEWLIGMGSIMKPGDVPMQVYKPLKDKYLNELFQRIRSRFGGYNVPKHSTAREIIKLKREGKKMVVGLITDQWPSGNEKYWTTFLGQETAFLNGAERIAKMMNFPVFYCDLTKPGRGYCVAEFKLMTEKPKETGEGEITEMFADYLEQTIRREPAYWLWSHKRWKASKAECERGVRMKVSVVILNWNGCDMLRTFLPSVIRYSKSEEVEVCVADNGSTDASVEMLREEFPCVRIIVLDQNHGFADGYNLALQQVEAEYVVLLNSDVEVTEHWLEPMISYLDGHPEVAACQPKIRSQRQKEYFEYAGAAGGFIDKYGYPFCRGRIMGVVEKDEGQYDTILPVFWATGAALFIRHADYREAGGLDGRFFAHMEEIDLCWRLRSRGREIVCIPQSTVYHVGGATLKKENPRKTFLNFRNNLVMLYKNLSDEELNKVMRIRTCLDYVAAFTFLLKGQLDNARAVMRARKEYKQICPSFSSSRKENLRKTSLNPIPERIKSSILWQFYVGGCKRFSQLSDLKG